MKKQYIGGPPVAAIGSHEHLRKKIQQLEAENKELRRQLSKAANEAKKWRAQTARTMKQAEKYRKASEPSGQSVRACSGGLPSLGKKQ